MQCPRCETTNPTGWKQCVNCGAPLPVAPGESTAPITDTSTVASGDGPTLITDTPQQPRTPFYANMGRWQQKVLYVVGIAVLCGLMLVVGVYPMISVLFGVILAYQFWKDNEYPQTAASILFFVGLGVLLYFEMAWPAALPLLVVALIVGQWSRLRALVSRSS